MSIIRRRHDSVVQSCPADSEFAVSAPRVLLVADARSPHAWGWVDSVRSAGIEVIGEDGRPWPRQPSSDADGLRRHRLRQQIRATAGATPRRLKALGVARRYTGLALTPIRGRRI